MSGRNRYAIHVSYLPCSTTEQDMVNLFINFDGAIGISLKFPKPDAHHTYGYVFFSDPDSMRKAISELKNFVFRGNRLSVHISAVTDIPPENIVTICAQCPERVEEIEDCYDRLYEAYNGEGLHPKSELMEKIQYQERSLVPMIKCLDTITVPTAEQILNVCLAK